MPQPNQTIGTVQVVLSAVDDRFRAGMLGAAKSVEGFVGQTKAALIGWASLATLKAFDDLIDRSMESVVALRRQADQLGISTEAMSGLRLAATQAGVSQDQFGASMAKLQQTMAGAAVESQQAMAALAGVNVTLSDLQGQSFDQQLGIIGDHLRAMGDSSARTTAAIRLFGEQGRLLLPVLMSGTAGLAHTRDEAVKLGLALNDIETQRVVEAKRSMDEAGEAVAGLGNRLASELSPYIREAAENFIALTKESDGFRQSVLDVTNAAVVGAQVLYNFGQGLKAAWGGFMTIVSGVTWAAVDVVSDVVAWFIGAGQLFANIFRGIGDSATAGAKMVEYAYRELKAQVLSVLAYLTDGLATMVEKVATVAGKFSKSLEADLRSAADSTRTYFGDAADAAKTDAEVTLHEWKTAADGAKDAWKKVFTPAGYDFSAFPKWLLDLNNTQAERTRQAYSDITAALNGYIPIDGITGWVRSANENMNAAVAASAKAGADIKANLAVSPASEDERLKNRRSFLGTADQDPRVLHERAVAEAYTKIGQERVDALARIEREEWVQRIAESPYVPQYLAKELVIQSTLTSIHEDGARARIQAERMEFQARLSAYGDFFGNLKTLTDAAAENNTALFIVNKAAAIAQAEVNAWLAYSNVLGQSSVLGAGVAQAFAATALAAGQVAVAQIAAQQPPGRASGGQVRRGALYEVGEMGPELLQVGSRNYLLPGAGGTVTSNADLQRMATSGARGGSSQPAPVNVIVHNYGNAQVTTRDTTDADGSRAVEVVVQQAAAAVAGQIRTGTGPVAGALRQTYPQLNRAAGAPR